MLSGPTRRSNARMARPRPLDAGRQSALSAARPAVTPAPRDELGAPARPTPRPRPSAEISAGDADVAPRVPEDGVTCHGNFVVGNPAADPGVAPRRPVDREQPDAGTGDADPVVAGLEPPPAPDDGPDVWGMFRRAQD